MLFDYTEIDHTLLRRHGFLVAGVDEVGVGSLIGPVCACALMAMEYPVVPQWLKFIGVDDSKKLSERHRFGLAHFLTRKTRWALGWATTHDIQRLGNVRKAAGLARYRAVMRLLRRVGLRAVCVDTMDMPEAHSLVTVYPIEHGDSRSVLIAAASVLAKCARDRYVLTLAKHYPWYDWENNKGYPTPKHLTSLSMYGPSRWHRQCMTRKYKRASQLAVAH